MESEKVDYVFKALAHAERRRILKTLYERPGQSLFEICVSSVADRGQPLSRQTITQHLDALERAELVEVSWMGRTKIHTVRLEPLQQAVDTAIGHYLHEGTK